MIDELELIKAIVGELSGKGLFFGIAYVVYLALSKVLVVSAVLYVVKCVLNTLEALINSGISRSEAIEMESQHESEKSRLYSRISELKSEVDAIKHKYAIMKELNENKKGG